MTAISARCGVAVSGIVALRKFVLLGRIHGNDPSATFVREAQEVRNFSEGGHCDGQLTSLQRGTASGSRPYCTSCAVISRTRPAAVCLRLSSHTASPCCRRSPASRAGRSRRGWRPICRGRSAGRAASHSGARTPLLTTHWFQPNRYAEVRD